MESHHHGTSTVVRQLRRVVPRRGMWARGTGTRTSAPCCSSPGVRPRPEGDGALQRGNPLTVHTTAVLLAFGADPQLPDPDGQTPMALSSGHSTELRGCRTDGVACLSLEMEIHEQST